MRLTYFICAETITLLYLVIGMAGFLLQWRHVLGPGELCETLLISFYMQSSHQILPSLPPLPTLLAQRVSQHLHSSPRRPILRHPIQNTVRHIITPLFLSHPG